jgi:hypothetical protein
MIRQLCRRDTLHAFRLESSTKFNVKRHYRFGRADDGVDVLLLRSCAFFPSYLVYYSLYEDCVNIYVACKIRNKFGDEVADRVGCQINPITRARRGPIRCAVGHICIADAIIDRTPRLQWHS